MAALNGEKAASKKSKLAALVERKQRTFLTKDGMIVLPQHKKQHGLVTFILKKILSDVDTEGKKIVHKTFEFPNPIADSSTVTTTSEDLIFYAKKKGKKHHSRFVIGREPEETNRLSITLERVDQLPRVYVIKGFIAGEAIPEVETLPRRPETPKGIFAEHTRATSRVYWQNHALRSEDYAVDHDTIQEECPW